MPICKKNSKICQLPSNAAIRCTKKQRAATCSYSCFMLPKLTLQVGVLFRNLCLAKRDINVASNGTETQSVLQAAVKNILWVLFFYLSLSKILITIRTMKELLENLNQLFAELSNNAALQIEKGNKTAGTRARKASLAMEKALKEFRKQSVSASK